MDVGNIMAAPERQRGREPAEVEVPKLSQAQV
jgi:hypothetical protein